MGSLALPLSLRLSQGLTISPQPEHAKLAVKVPGIDLNALREGAHSKSVSFWHQGFIKLFREEWMVAALLVAIEVQELAKAGDV